MPKPGLDNDRFHSIVRHLNHHHTLCRRETLPRPYRVKHHPTAVHKSHIIYGALLVLQPHVPLQVIVVAGPVCALTAHLLRQVGRVLEPLVPAQLRPAFAHKAALPAPEVLVGRMLHRMAIEVTLKFGHKSTAGGAARPTGGRRLWAVLLARVTVVDLEVGPEAVIAAVGPLAGGAGVDKRAAAALSSRRFLINLCMAPFHVQQQEFPFPEGAELRFRNIF